VRRSDARVVGDRMTLAAGSSAADWMAERLRDLQLCVGREVDGLIGRVLHTMQAPARADAPTAGRSSVLPPSSGDAWPGSSDNPLTDEDREVIGRVDEFLAKGLDLNRWWTRAHASQTFAHRFELGRTFNDPTESYGFFDVTSVAGHDMPVMGNFQEMFYDQERGPSTAAELGPWLHRQMREFVLRYFMRVSSFREPDAYVPGAALAPADWTRPLSWCPEEDVQRRGFGFEQLYYKRARTGVVGKFAEENRHAIVDLREIGREYEWIVVRVTIFNFDMVVRPFGHGTPSLVVPLAEDSLLVLSREFLVDESANGTARFGLGYAFIKKPAPEIVAYGPGQFDAAIELIEFAVVQDCSVRVRMVFVANRPTRVVNVSLDPTTWALRAVQLLTGGAAGAGSGDGLGRWSFDPIYAYVTLANLITAGLAAERFCISREQLDRDFLVQHFMQHYHAIVGSLATWRRVRDWCDGPSLPSWISTGLST
jgi:hypothetical protein